MTSKEQQEQFGNLMQLVSAFRKARVITTAVEYNLFSRFSDGPHPLDEIAHPGEDEEALFRLCNALVALGLLIKTRQKYQNTKVAEHFLTDDAPHDLRPMLHLQHRSYQVWSYLDQAIQEGQPLDPHEEKGDTDDWSPSFIAAMEARTHFSKQPVMTKVSEYIDEGWFLDLGGGSGVYTRELLRQQPKVQGTVADLPHVIETARQFAEGSPVADRLHFKELDLIEDDHYGKEYNVAFLSAIIHIFGPETNQRILEKAYQALNPGGALIILDYIMDESKTAPVNGTLFGLHMLLATENGNVYSQQEVDQWLEKAGFQPSKRVELDESADLLVAQR